VITTIGQIADSCLSNAGIHCPFLSPLLFLNNAYFSNTDQRIILIALSILF